MKIYWIIVVGILFSMSISTAKAADFRAPAGESGNVSISKTERTNNLYIAGANVSSDAIVTGDLVVAGSNVSLNGTVEHGIIAAGGNVIINADAGQNMRLVGGTVVFNGQTGEDLAVAGGTVNLSSSSLVTGDLMIAGGSLKIDGTVNGRVFGSGGDVVIGGHVKGDVKLTGINSLELTSTAVIEGKLIYSSTSEATISSSAKVLGGTDYQKTAGKNYDFGSDSLFSIWMMLASIVLGLVLVYGFRRTSMAIIEDNRLHFWASMGIGLVTLIVVPAAIIIFMITVIGMKLAMLLGALYWLLIAFGSIFNSLFVGSEVYLLIKKSEKRRNDWLTVLIGVVITSLLVLIPYVGWLVWFGLFLSALGTVTKHTFAGFPQKENS